MIVAQNRSGRPKPYKNQANYHLYGTAFGRRFLIMRKLK